jgi:DNA-binding LacI/PurR family transcriptional regulator
MPKQYRRVTQQEIARIAGVSQATVSLVLNDPEGASTRIPEATRERVRRAIEQTTYVPDPAARRLAGMSNRIVGVFAYEAALSPQTMDFYGPLLNGIESAAEAAACDVLLFTSSPVVDGRRHIYDPRTRLRLADGCLLLGQDMDGAELERLAEEGFPFVAVGRRDERNVPYVGIDYRKLVEALLALAEALGHRRAVYVHGGHDSPAARDRLEQLAATSEAGPVDVHVVATPDGDLPAVEEILSTQPTLVIGDDAFMTRSVADALYAADPTSGDVLSFAALGEVEGHLLDGRQLTGFHTPRAEIAASALSLLLQLIEGSVEPADEAQTRRLLDGSVEPGATLHPAGNRQ